MGNPISEECMASGRGLDLSILCFLPSHRDALHNIGWLWKTDQKLCCFPSSPPNIKVGGAVRGGPGPLLRT